MLTLILNLQKILIDTKTSLALAHALGEGRYHVTRSAVADAKAIKNEVELEGFRQSHIRDGVALVCVALAFCVTVTNPPPVPGTIFCPSRGASQVIGIA